MSECLTTIEIERLLADSLPPEQKARAKAHLAECENCRERLRQRQAHGRLNELSLHEAVRITRESNEPMYTAQALG